jgi:hypothetical protein
MIVAGLKGIAFQRCVIAFPPRKEVEKAIALIYQRFLMEGEIAPIRLNT